MEAAVVLFIFNRPHVTQKLLEVVSQVKPKKIFVIADGPRDDHFDEEKQCTITRETINQIDWECEIVRNYSQINLGCAKRIASGLDWVFEQVDRAIILEDDCMPDKSFFQFCEELLEKYRDDTRIFSITGQNIQAGKNSTEHSYYFSRYSHCWGWATWKRSWKYFDFEIPSWSDAKKHKALETIFEDKYAAYRWLELIERTIAGEIDSWAYRWSLCCMLQHALHIIPNQNLVSNIGFGLGSTNTHSRESRLANIPAMPIQFPLIHPPYF
jgi:hypothetical protein